MKLLHGQKLLEIFETCDTPRLSYEFIALAGNLRNIETYLDHY